MGALSLTHRLYPLGDGYSEQCAGVPGAGAYQVGIMGDGGSSSIGGQVMAVKRTKKRGGSTGGRRPPPFIIESARAAHIPLLLVKGDTFSTLEQLEKSPPLISTEDEKKALYFSEMLDRHGAFERLLQSLGLE